MSKIIIHNRSDLNDTDALYLVMKVTQDGRVSKDNTQYCYASVFTLETGKKYLVSTDINKKSDRFYVVNTR